MLNFIFYFSIFFISTISLSILAQQSITDTTFQLKEIVVTANRLQNFSSGTKIQKIDSANFSQYKSGNLTNLLENESPLFIRSYGLGSLAVSSFRGGSANHTAILWNGFNLNNPMNGQFDFSLIPNNFINSVNIQYGGTSSLWGSGAVGGVIHLNSYPKFNSGINFSAGSSVGSFESYRENGEIEISKEKWISSIKFFNASAKNNFEFQNIFLVDSPKQKQTNAELKQYGFLSENYFRINENQKIDFRFWYQKSDRNIPPTMLLMVNKSNQKDESYRITSEWQRVGEKINCFARVAYFDENLVYSDYTYHYESFNHSQTFIAETEAKIQLHKNHFINFGLNNTFSQAVSDGYSYQPKQNRLAGFASYRINSTDQKINATFSAREELIKNTFVPFTFSLGSEYNFVHWLSAKANISKVYRLPAFNDLYWTPGGNPNLLPENGYSEEIGIILKPFSEHSIIFFSFEPTIFSRKMNNWILWLPSQNYWMPQNILEVWSRGMETKSELIFKLNSLKLKTSVLTNYVVSTNEKSISENDNSIDKQLIYVPMYSGHGKFSAEYKGFLFSCSQNYTGYRYTSTDNYEYIEPFMLTNLYASQKIQFNNFSLNFFVQINNLFNKNYQVLRYRAMPARNYQAGISIQFNKSNNSK